MRKTVAFIVAGTSAAAALIYLSGYGYLFKAIGINLKKGPMAPSNDDGEKFPYHTIPNENPKPWKEAQGHPSNFMSERLAEDLSKSRASSLLVIKDKELIFEKYWKGHSPVSLMNSFSIAKGILSILVGCAIDDGHLQSEDDLISSVFPQYKDSRYGQFLIIRHLMTMQAGLDRDEEYRHPFAPNSKQYFVDDLAAQVLGIELREMPGNRYEYQSAAAQLLGLVLRKVTGQYLADYLSEKIWKPLNMEYPAKWSTDEKGMEKAFCCIHSTTRDLAKIGQLILQDGNWEGTQLINADYFKRMLTPTKRNDAFCYTIWADNDNGIKYRFFYGLLGQFIIIIPQEKMVIVKTGLYNRLEVDEKKRPLQVRMLVEELLAAMKE